MTLQTIKVYIRVIAHHFSTSLSTSDKYTFRQFYPTSPQEWSLRSFNKYKVHKICDHYNSTIITAYMTRIVNESYRLYFHIKHFNAHLSPSVGVSSMTNDTIYINLNL